jgi:hypothetical protein
MWTTVNPTTAQAVTLWKVRALLKWMAPFKDFPRGKEMKLRQDWQQDKGDMDT